MLRQSVVLVALCVGTTSASAFETKAPLKVTPSLTTPKTWEGAPIVYRNSGRPHSALGPGVPDPPKEQKLIPKSETRHRLAAGALVLAKSVLGGLHHEYSLAPASA